MFRAQGRWLLRVGAEEGTQATLGFGVVRELKIKRKIATAGHTKKDGCRAFDYLSGG